MCEESEILIPIKDEKRRKFYKMEFILENFFRARNFDIKKSFEMWCNWVTWREKFKPDEFGYKEVSLEFEKGRAFFFGKDKEGRVVLILKPARHIPGESEVENLKKMGYFILESAIKFGHDLDKHQILVIYDRTGVTKKNFDTSLFKIYKDLIPEFQNFYPERMFKILVLHANFFYKTMFAMIKPFLAKYTKEKIKLLSDIKELKEFINEDQLLKEHGGVHVDPFENKDYDFKEIFEKEGVLAFYDPNKRGKEKEEEEEEVVMNVNVKNLR